jgi:hypothetical protein
VREWDSRRRATRVSITMFAFISTTCFYSLVFLFKLLSTQTSQTIYRVNEQAS